MFRLDWKGKEVQEDVHNALAEGLRDAAQYILDESNKLVPIDEGTLQRSGNTSVDNTSATIYYDTPYATRVHEDVTMRHKNGRRAKFLESALNENTTRIEQIISNKIKEVL